MRVSFLCFRLLSITAFMFAGAQIVTTKSVLNDKQKQLIDNENEDKTAKDLVNMSELVEQPRTAIVAETEEDKIQRKLLAQERRYERVLEQQKHVDHMEDLMEKVLHEKTLSQKDEDSLRSEINTIVTKVKKETEKAKAQARHLAASEPSTSLSSASRKNLNSVEQENIQPKSLKQSNQRAFLLWYDKNLS